MQHYRKPPRKSFFTYIAPFLIIIFSGAIVYLMIKFWNNVGSSFTSETSYAVMETQTGEAKVMLFGTTDWEAVPASKLKLYKGDGIRALPGSRVRVDLFEKHYITMSGNAELALTDLSKDNSTMHTSLTLTQGEAWFNVARDINPNSTFVVKTDDLEVKTDGAVFDLEANVVRVIKGDVNVAIYDGKTLLTNEKIGVGQELVLTDAKKQALIDKDEDIELLSMLSNEFKLSDWYLYNMEGKKIEILPTETGANLSETIDSLEEKTIEKKEEEKKEETFVLDKPVITSPAKDGSKYTLTESSQVIEGTVKKGTAKVSVNNYVLQSFKPGDTVWKYNASTQYANLVKGENLYEIYAMDSEGNKSAIAKITLVYTPAITETEKTTETTKEATTTKATEKEETTTTTKTTETTVVSGTLSITAPNGGADYTTKETRIVLQGTAPSNAAKIVVSGYTLQSYTAGSSTWRYTADPQYSNLVVGEKNTYTVTAYDAENKMIGTANISITVEGSAKTATGTVVD